MAILRMERKASDNEYFHRDFHISADCGLRYLGERFGDEAVIAYLTEFAKTYYRPLTAKAEISGLAALKEHIEAVYKTEKAEDAVKCTLTDTELRVEVSYCPAVRYMRASGCEPSKWYVELTNTVSKTIADSLSMRFEMLYYDDESGAALYRFIRE